jgi:hypothetical protein
MKINWGTGITIAIVLFMSFIIVMVVKMTGTHTDLFADDYYNQEIEFQDKIDAQNNVKNLEGYFEVDQTSDLIIVKFPQEFSSTDVVGTIQLYRPDNAEMDLIISIKLKDNMQFISKSELSKGKYTLKTSCIVKNISYFHKQELKI